LPNRLAQETSPYLLQHKDNPVDWYPWGEEALSLAREQKKPILLSIGYSACHWCHVMERESFENEEIAAQMNRDFVSIKVDREERPDIDSIYMTAIQALAGHGGWPLTVFLMPDGKPFYGGTYFPPVDRGGMPGFPKVLTAVSEAYLNQKSDLEATTDRLLDQIRQTTLAGQSPQALNEADLTSAYVVLAAQADRDLGGLSGAPKFPQPMIYEFLLRHHVRTGEPESLEMVTTTLDAMAEAGIYDQAGGGFHRYSTDERWLVPHFEKMLYDNALLVRLYTHAYQVTGYSSYKRVVDETLRYALREMQTPDGLFYSAQDADSEGVEGKFFVWSPSELNDVLGPQDGQRMAAYFDVTEDGNFEGFSILNYTADLRGALKDNGPGVQAFVDEAKARLYAARAGRVPPATDDKVLTAWNGLMVAALAEASAVLGNTEYANAATRCAETLLTVLRRDGRLLRTYKDGIAKLNGYLEDYAFLTDGLLALHEATLEPGWLVEAIDLGKSMIELFWDRATGQFYDTGSDHEQLVVRPRDISDNAIPSGSSAACAVLLRLAVYTGDAEMHRLATESLRSARELMVRVPAGAGHWLSALDFYLGTTREVVIAGEPDDDATQALLREVYRHYLPNRVVMGVSGNEVLVELPLAEARETINGTSTAYVCENYACQMPTTDPAVLAEQLVD
jgi:uncharacterized protein YyaL (SSP411 family)